jgi:beta-galactosidase
LKTTYSYTGLLLSLFICTIAQAQVSRRLNDNWEFIKQDLGGVWEAVRPLTKTGPENYPVWQSVPLPHCMNAEDAVDAEPNYYQGAGWYRSQLNIDNPYANGRTLLHFEGAGQKTAVYVYTTKVGEHVGGYDEFTIDITDAVAAFKKTEQFKGKVPIVVRVDNSRDLQMIPSNLSDFVIYGGIYRYLNLVYVPAVSIDKIFVKPGNQVEVKLYNPTNASNVKIITRFFDPAGKKIEPAAKNIQYWSPDNPVLYKVEALVIHDDDTAIQTEKFGFRNFKFQPKGPFFLNGKRVLLKGTHRHEDAAGVGAALTEEMMRKEMLQIKSMGANFIRLGHYQQSRTVLDLCDSLGLLVWEEIPWCRGGLGEDKYKEQARRMLTNMIGQHYNHPSVILWGLGNENDWPGDQPVLDKEKIRAFMKELHELSHSLDPSRKTAIRRCDFCRDIVDVYSPSIWMGWYKGSFTDYKKESKQEFDRSNSFLHVEWGGDSHAGRHSEKIETALQHSDSTFVEFAQQAKNNDWSETYICNLFDWHLKEQETMPWLTGSAFWTFKDFATPIRPENPVPYVNQKGVVERDGTLKESFYVFQSYWSKQPMVHIYGHSWPVRWGNAGEEKLVKVYSNCDEVELFVNGRSLGVRKRRSQDYPAAGLRWNVVFKEGGNEIYAVGKKGTVHVKDTISTVYQTTKWGAPAKLLLQKTTNGIVVTLVDAQGVACLDAMNLVSFQLAGDGKLIGSSRIQLSNGRAKIKVEGSGVVSVSSIGLPAAFLQVE